MAHSSGCVGRELMSRRASLCMKTSSLGMSIAGQRGSISLTSLLKARRKSPITSRPVGRKRKLLWWRLRVSISSRAAPQSFGRLRGWSFPAYFGRYPQPIVPDRAGQEPARQRIAVALPRCEHNSHVYSISPQSSGWGPKPTASSFC